MESLINDNSIEPLPFKPVVLLLLDGWGIAPASDANLISLAKTPNFLNLVKEYPVALLDAKNKNVNTRYLSMGSGRDASSENIETVISLSEVIAKSNLRQIKITETERLAALTYFFNGCSEDKFSQEEWKIISSKTSGEEINLTLIANQIIKELLDSIESEKYDFSVISLPTLDLAARNGDEKLINKAIESIDKNLKKITEEILDKKGILIISSAGGNVENVKSMITELPDKEITNNPVPLIIIGEDFNGKTIGLIEPVNDDLSLLAPAGNLGDLAPTILDIMNLVKPEEMTGKSLINKK